MQHAITKGKLTVRASYAASEVGGQLIFCVISFYLLKFYTDVYGISAVAAGSILLIARLVDAFDAPVWGIIFEKTQSRWGMSRPWFLWLCGPFAIFGVLTFATPNISPLPKILYAASTYIATSILYTGVNTPVTSILASLTPDSKERITLTTFRMFGSKLGVLVVNLSFLPLVTVMGHGNDRRGFMLVMPLYACCTVVLYLTAFRNLQETVRQRPPQYPVRKSFAALRSNIPWLIIFTSSLFFWIAFIARISMAPYFFQYTLQHGGLTSIANSLDAVSLGTILFLPYLCRKTLKRNVWAIGLLGSALGQFIVFLGASNESLRLTFVGWILGFLASGLAMALPFSLLSDSIDYGEWKTGLRTAGLLTAIGAAFSLKAGSGLGAAIPAWIMSATGYVPNARQSPKALFGIEIGFIWLPVAAYLLAAVPTLFYGRYERMESTIRRELEERRLAATLMSESI